MNRPTPLRPCPRCGRHHRSSETTCPFCGHSNFWTGKVPTSVAAAMSAFVLMACYGAPPDDLDTDDTETMDVDEDGYTPAEGDCDDSDFDINPDADEVCDDTIDNDCDDLIDGDDDECMD